MDDYIKLKKTKDPVIDKNKSLSGLHSSKMKRKIFTRPDDSNYLWPNRFNKSSTAAISSMKKVEHKVPRTSESHLTSFKNHGLDSSLTKNSQIETSKVSSSFLQKPYGAEILKQKCRTHTDSKSLVKLKETIKKQKENRSPDHVLSQPKQSGFNVLPTRKVRLGPSAPSYKGFSPIETRFQTQSERLIGYKSLNNVSSVKGSVSSKFSRNKSSTIHEDNKQKSVVRKTGKLSSNQSFNKSLPITPSSWREGYKVAEAVLDSMLKKENVHQKPGPTQSKTADAGNSTTFELKDSKKPISNLGLLSTDAKSVLLDLNKSSHEESARKPEAIKTSPPVKVSKKKPMSFPKADTINIPKKRHYDSAKVRQYIAKQRADRKRKQDENKKMEKQATEKRTQLLDSLNKRRRKELKSINVKKSVSSESAVACKTTPSSDLQLISQKCNEKLEIFLQKLEQVMESGESVGSQSGKNTQEFTETKNDSVSISQYHNESVEKHSYLDDLDFIPVSTSNNRSKFYSSLNVSGGNFNLEPQFSKLDRIASLRAKSESLQERIDLESSRIIETQKKSNSSGFESSRSIETPKKSTSTGFERMLSSSSENLSMDESSNSSNQTLSESDHFSVDKVIPPEPEEDVVLKKTEYSVNSKSYDGFDTCDSSSHSLTAVSHSLKDVSPEYSNATRNQEAQKQNQHNLNQLYSNLNLPFGKDETGDKYSVMNVFTRKYMKSQLSLHTIPSNTNKQLPEPTLNIPSPSTTIRSSDNYSSSSNSHRVEEFLSLPSPASKKVDVKIDQDLKENKSLDLPEIDDETSSFEERPFPQTFHAPQSTLRFSPAVLEQKLNAELSRFETINDQMNILTNTEKNQGISLAQEESVSIAHVLQSRQVEHEIELERLALKAKKKAVEATQKLIETKLNNDASENAASDHDKEKQNVKKKSSNSLTEQSETSVTSSTTSPEFSPKKSSMVNATSSKQNQKTVLRPAATNFNVDRSNASMSSDDVLQLSDESFPSTLDESLESSSSVYGDSESNSFNHFINEHVRQSMLEEEVRSKHEAAILKIRKQALKEKTEAELAWLELHEQEISSKGKTDQMIPVKKKKRSILRKWQVEAEEIKRLKAANRAASQDRKTVLQRQDRNLINTQQSSENFNSHKDGVNKDVKSRPSSLPLTLQHAPASPDYDGDATNKSNHSQSSSMVSELSKKFKTPFPGLDGQQLTIREKALLKRKKEAEKLLEWKKKLDEEEKKVLTMEHQALNIWNQKDTSHELSNKKNSHNNKSSTQDSVLPNVSQFVTKPPMSNKDALISPIASLPSRDNKLSMFSKRSSAIESLSDDSFSQTQSETEQSDVECRVHALKDELKQRRLIVERLRKQQKKKQKDHLRAQEASLKSQIEAYDAFIKSTQQELNLDEAAVQTTKPQIRSPRKSEQNHQTVRSLKSSISSVSPDASPRAGTQKSLIGSLVTRQQSDSDSSGRSSWSLSFDDEVHYSDDIHIPFARSTEKKLAKPSSSVSESSKSLDLQNALSKTVKSVSNHSIEKTSSLATTPTETDQVKIASKTSEEEEEEDHESTKSSLSSVQLNKDIIEDDDLTPVPSPSATRSSSPSTPTPNYQPLNFFSSSSNLQSDLQPVMKKKEVSSVDKIKLDDFTDEVLNNLLDNSVSCIFTLYKSSDDKAELPDVTESSKIQNTVENIYSYISYNLLNDSLTKILSIKTTNTFDSDATILSPEADFGYKVEVNLKDERNDVSLIARPVSPVFGVSQVADDWMKNNLGFSTTFFDLSEDSDDQASVDLQQYVPRSEISDADKSILAHSGNKFEKLAESMITYLETKHSNGQLYIDHFTSFESYESNEQITSTDSITISFHQSLFDLVRQLLREVYADNKEMQNNVPWNKTRWKKKASLVHCLANSTKDFKLFVKREIAHLYGYVGTEKCVDNRFSLKWGNLKKKDSVDLILIEELREEETDWTNYNVDEAAVKTQLTETVFDLLLNDTISCLNKMATSR